MATHKSAEKKNRQSIETRLRNKGHRSKMKSEIKKFLEAVKSQDKDRAASLLPKTLSIIDVSAKHGVIHRNTASRYKSGLTKKFNALNQSGEAKAD